MQPQQSTTPFNKEKLNLSTITVDLPHSDLTDLDPETPSLGKELAAAGVYLVDETVTHGSGDATTQATGVYTSFNQLHLSCIKEENEDE